MTTSTVGIDQFIFAWVQCDVRYRPIFFYYESYRPSILTIFSRRWNQIDRWYRPYSSVGLMESTVYINLDKSSGRLKSNRPIDDTCEIFSMVCLMQTKQCRHYLWDPRSSLCDPNSRRTTCGNLFQGLKMVGAPAVGKRWPLPRRAGGKNVIGIQTWFGKEIYNLNELHASRARGGIIIREIELKSV